MLKTREKWRPSLKLVIALVVATLVALPLIGLLTARLTSNQFVRETENSLNAQAAILAEVFTSEFTRLGGESDFGYEMPNDLKEYYSQEFHPRPVLLTTNSSDILPERPSPRLTFEESPPVYKKIGTAITEMAERAQKTSLSGYQAVDIYGNIIGGTGGLTGSFAHVKEIQVALKGYPSALLRYRSDRKNRHPLKLVSRDTSFRVFVAMPVINDDRVIGAVYLTRTPNNLRNFLVRERQTVLLVFLFVLFSGFIVGLMLWRMIAGPIRALQSSSEKLARGQSNHQYNLSQYGTSELASLSDSFVKMSTKLKQRSDSLQSYTAHVTHELKSPLTSIIGAIELLEESGQRMKPASQKRFFSNIRKDGDRMTRLLDDLKRFAASDMIKFSENSSLEMAVVKCQKSFPKLKVTYSGKSNLTVPMTLQDFELVLYHLAQNASQHGASKMSIEADDTAILVNDNGKGISEANRSKIFEPFFTTKRDAGGTGMGLAIVRNIIASHGGAIEVTSAETGASFRIKF